MSEFAGIWRLDGRPANETDLACLAQNLAAKDIANPRIWRFGAMGWVHRQHFFTPEDRLERQPIVGASGLTLMADVRLSDRTALLRALDLPKEFINQADSVLMLHAIERWGTETALKRLCGEFSFSLWNPNTQSLTLARDPSGMRSLFIFRNNKLIAFSTRIRALLALPEVSRELDEQALADSVVLNQTRPLRTIYREIDRIPMGHLAVLSKDNLKLNRYWHQPKPGTLKRATDREYEEEAQEVLDRAVSDAMRGIEPVCSFLTGGLDSAAVTLSAAKQSSPNKLTVLTRAPSGPIPPDTPFVYHDESLRAQKLAELYPNMDWHKVEADGDVWRQQDLSLYFLESGLPQRMHFNLAWFFPLYRAIGAKGSNVCLTGDSGNAFFSYDGLSLLPELFFKLRWKNLFEHLQALSQTENLSLLKAFRRVLGPVEPLWLRRQRIGYKEVHWSRHCALNPDFARELRFDETLDWSKYRIRLGAGYPSTQETRRWMSEAEASQDSTGIIRAMTGLDLRAPLTDKRVVEFFGALPLDQFLKDGVTRSITRRLLAGKVPDQTLQRRPRGLQNGDWFSRLSASRPGMLVDIARLKTSPLASRVIDLHQLQTLLDDWPENIAVAELRRRDYCYKLTRGMEMASFLAWYENHG